jgi:hypothetical protein
MPAPFDLVALELQVDDQLVLRTGSAGITRGVEVLIWEGNRPAGEHRLELLARLKASRGTLAGFYFNVNARQSTTCSRGPVTRVGIVSYERPPDH